jgi:serine/threonine protein kinase
VNFQERYRIDRELGQGGMGRVLGAFDLKLERPVAIKVLAPGAHGDDDLRRLEQEARAAGSLNHPNVLTVYDLGTDAAGPYIVSELLEGTTFRARLGKGPLPREEAVAYMLQLASGLAAAHGKGIVHRDLKPENLFLCADGRLKILDFGIAKLSGPALRETLAATGVRTQEGTILGSVGYMSPEQVRGEPADARSDLFAAGAILYEMISGTRLSRRDAAGERHRRAGPRAAPAGRRRTAGSRAALPAEGSARTVPVG